MAVQIALAEHIAANSMPEPNSGCHLWLLSVNEDGYGKTSARRFGEQLAHRAAWLAHFGPAAGRLVCHKCDVRSCVNPDHLFLGTHQDNCDDKWRKNRANMPRGSRHGMSKITEEAAAAIRIDARSYRQIAKAFGISKSNVAFIKAGATWGHV